MYCSTYPSAQLGRTAVLVDYQARQTPFGNQLRSSKMRNFFQLVRHDLTDPSGFLLICVLGAVGLLLVGMAI